MNDLISRKALRDELRAESDALSGVGWVDARTLSLCLALLDAAPTVSCEECKHDNYCYRTLEWHIAGGQRDKHYPSSCSLFERKQP